MCLGVPGKIVRRWQGDDGALLATADFAGEERVIRLNYLPDLAPGDYTIVHAGFALTRLDAEEAATTMQLMRDVGLLDAPSGNAAAVTEGGVSA
jgi:hydrogenase expression/formation protein HypC